MKEDMIFIKSKVIACKIRNYQFPKLHLKPEYNRVRFNIDIISNFVIFKKNSFAIRRYYWLIFYIENEGIQYHLIKNNVNFIMLKFL